MATFDYTNRDFLSIRQDLLNRASRVIPEWTSTDASDFGNVMVDLLAYMGDILHFYVDRAAGEAFLQTATQRESVLAIANLMDYIPSSTRAARGSVVFQLNTLPVGELSYTVPQYTTLTGFDADGNSYQFYTISASSALTTVGDTTTVTVVQGTIIQNEALGLSTGYANQKISLIKKNVDIDSLVVNVAEGPLDAFGDPTTVQYQYVSQISTANYLDKVFTTKLLSDGSTQIIFGNGFNGVIPTTNAEMTATYRTTDGGAGNIPANKIVVINGTPNSYVGIASSSATSGGADAESLESIRNNIARLYRTQDRAVSLQDYKDLCLSVPGISKATATVSGSVITLYPVPHQSDYPPSPTAGVVSIPISTPLAEYIEQYFATRSVIGTSAEVVGTNSIVCTPVYVRLKLHIQDNYVQTWVADQVDAAVRSLLTFDRVSFGQVVTVGDVYRAALSVVGVDYVEIINLSTTYSSSNTTGSGGATVGNIQIDATKLPCFSDEVSSNIAVTFTPHVGGLTGTN